MASKRSNKLAAVDGGSHADAQAIATRIRTTRRQMRMTLDILAERTQLDKGYLSRIERGQKTPSIGTILRIAEALSVQVGHLFGEKTRPGAITVIRRGRHKEFPGKPDASGAVFEAVLPATGTRHLSAYIALPGLDADMKPADHPGDELMYVLRGTVQVTFADREITLEAGDCVHFEGHLKHQLRRIGAKTAEVLIVIGQDLPAASQTASAPRTQRAARTTR